MDAMSPTPPGRARTRAALLTLYAHPFELATAIILGVSAVETLLRPEELTAALGAGLAAVWVAANTLGIALIVTGLIGSADVTGDRPKLRAFYRGTEKAGLILVAGATTAYAVLIGAHDPISIDTAASIVQLGAIAGACILRTLAIRKAERIQLEELRRMSRVTATEYLDNLLRPTSDDDARGGDR